MMFKEESLPPLKFTQAELSANRNGYMMPPQRQRLENILAERRHLFPRAIAFACLPLLFGLYMLLSGDLLPALFGGFLLALVVFLVWTGVMNYRNLREDARKNDVLMSEGVIQLSEGNLFFEGNGRLKINGLEFGIPLELARTLRNGSTYRVYYTPKAKLLLSYEEAQSKGTVDFDAPLRKQLRFDAQTLATNREGKLTPAQRTRLKFYPLRHFMSRMLLLFFAWGLLMLASLKMDNEALRQGMWVLFAIGAGVLFFFEIGHSIYKGRPAWRDLREDKAYPVAGLVRWKDDKGNTGIEIGESLLWLSKQDRSVFQQGEKYRVFVTLHTGSILSAEHLKD